MEIRRTFDILEKLRTYAPKADLLNAKVNKAWKSYSYQDLCDNAAHLGSGLLDLGLVQGDRVCIMSANLPEWNFVDYGCQVSGMVTAPVYPTISSNDLKFILNHSEAKVIFISERSSWNQLAEIKSELTHLRHIFSFREIEGATPFSDLLKRGAAVYDPSRIENIKASIGENDLFTILYTSGTTGEPKGVMISHRNLVSNVLICQDIAPFTTEWRALSFLPLNHVYERFLNTVYLFHGVSIFYAESFETIGENCREIHPEIFVAVPRVLERVLDRITSAGEKLTGIKKRIFDWSMRLAENYELCGANGPFYELKRKIADALVYKKWRAAVGGKVKVIVSGGAALNPRIERIFTCARLELLQGYGLTETCVVVAVNRYDQKDRQFGTVGLVVENSEVKLAPEDGEILVKGPSVMMGYYKNPVATAEVISPDGWFHTGDIGTMVDGRFLKITDRKKEIFKSSAGKYIAPMAIENKLKECRYIEQCMVVGEGQKFASALIVPAFASLKELCESGGIPWEGNEKMAESPFVKKIVSDHIAKVNSTLGPFEQIKRPRIITSQWTVSGGEITPKLSLKRKVIAERNRQVIQEIFWEQ